MQRQPAYTRLLLLVVMLRLCIAYGDHRENADDNDGYYSRRDYKPGYAADKCPDCPKPQPADSVENAYITHHTFVWAELAAAVAARKGTQERRHSDDVIRHKTPPKGATSSTRGVPKPRVAAPNHQQVAGQHNTSNSSHPAASPADQNRASTHGSRPQGHDTAVHSAAVTDSRFLLPTSLQESGSGFYGTQDFGVPTDQAVAVGPHPSDPDAVLVMHGINRAIEVFAATRDGQQLPSSVPTKLQTWDIMEAMGYSLKLLDNLQSVDINAFYDQADERYVIIFSSIYYKEDKAGPTTHPPLFVCVSHNNNPLGKFTCWALQSNTYAQPFTRFCDGQPVWTLIPDYPQASYSNDALFIDIGLFCADSFLNTLYAFPKRVLYTPPADNQADINVWRATYLPSSSWYHSLPSKDQLLVYDPTDPSFTNPFNTFLLPARPQIRKDVSDPMFVMGKVNGNRYLSVAKLTNEPFDEMDSRATAPRIYAMVLSKEAEFASGDSVIPQPQDGTPLDAGDLDYGTYAATKYRGRVYMATPEFFGVGGTSVPSIYWAIIDPSPDLCTPSLLDWGMVASEQGLALAFPAMAAREECGALLAYVYGGNTTLLLDGNSYPAYAGVAASVVGCKGIRSGVDIVKRGEGLITRYPEDGIQRWGDYSALDVFDGVAWFAVPVARNNQPQYGSWIFAEGL